MARARNQITYETSDPRLVRPIVEAFGVGEIDVELVISRTTRLRVTVDLAPAPKAPRGAPR